MSNIDKRALREVAENAKSVGDISRYEAMTALTEFEAAAKPATVLALLDELESKDKRIAELEARTLVPVEPTLDQLVAGKRRLTSTGRMSRLMSQRLAEVYRAMVSAAAAGKGE